MDLGLTQRTQAEGLGCWQRTVVAWEWYESIPLAARWPAIEAVLGPGLAPERDGLPGRALTTSLRLGLTLGSLAEAAGLDIRTIRNTE